MKVNVWLVMSRDSKVHSCLFSVQRANHSLAVLILAFICWTCILSLKNFIWVKWVHDCWVVCVTEIILSLGPGSHIDGRSLRAKWIPLTPCLHRERFHLPWQGVWQAEGQATSEWQCCGNGLAESMGSSIVDCFVPFTGTLPHFCYADHEHFFIIIFTGKICLKLFSTKYMGGGGGGCEFEPTISCFF